jgi:hypothetical protein
MAARLRRWSAPLMQETCRKRWIVCSMTVGCPAADISVGRIEDFSLGCSGPTGVAAPATVARFVADGDSTATITKPIPSRGEEKESNPGHFTETGQHSRPLHEGNGAKTLIGSHIPLLAYPL